MLSGRACETSEAAVAGATLQGWARAVQEKHRGGPSWSAGGDCGPSRAQDQTWRKMQEQQAFLVTCNEY